MRTLRPLPKLEARACLSAIRSTDSGSVVQNRLRNLERNSWKSAGPESTRQFGVVGTSHFYLIPDGARITD